MNSNDADDDRQRITRRRGACNLCREKKVRCNGRNPCSFCERHQADCSYQLPPRKTQNPNQKANRPESIFTVDSGASTGWRKRLYHEFVESTNEPGGSLEASWPTGPGGIEFDEELNLMDLVFEGSPRHRPQTSSTLNPSTSTVSSDNNDLDWLTQSPTIVEIPENTGLDSALKESNSYSTFHTPICLLDMLQEGSAFDNNSALEAAPRREPVKRKATIRSPVSKRYQRHRSFSLSTLKQDSLSSFSPYMSTLLPASRETGSEISNPKPSIFQPIVTKLLSRDYLVGLPLSWTTTSTNTPVQEAPDTIDDLSATLMTQLIGLCFDEPWGVALFLYKSDAYKLLRKHKTDIAVDEEAELDDVIDNFLLSILLAWGAAINTNEDPALAYTLSMQVIEAYQDVISVPESIDKFLALVCMSMYAFRIGLPQCPAILAQAVSLVQSLNLHLTSGLASLSLAGRTMNQIKRACWVLFCVDKNYAMRWRTFSLLPGIEYTHPSIEFDRDGGQSLDYCKNDWLSTWCNYAEICSRISSVSLSRLGQEPPDNSQGVAATEKYEQTVRGLLADLKTCYVSIPGEARAPSLDKIPSGRLSQRHWTISLAYSYYEAVLAVMGLLNRRPISPSLRLPCLAMSADMGTQSPSMITHESIKGILQLSHHIMNFKDDRTLLHVPTLALCMLAVEQGKCNAAMSPLPSRREIQTLFAMAYGLFGRFAATLPHEDFFDSVTELFAVVADR